MPIVLEPGDEAVVGVVGCFGARLAEMARRAGAAVRGLERPLGQRKGSRRAEIGTAGPTSAWPAGSSGWACRSSRRPRTAFPSST